MKHFLLLLRFKVGSIILERFIYLFIEIWLKKSSLEIFSNRLIESRVLIHVDISKRVFLKLSSLSIETRGKYPCFQTRVVDKRFAFANEKRRKKKETRSNDKEEDRVAPRKNYRGERLASNTGVCQSGEEWESSPRENGRMKERGGRGGKIWEMHCSVLYYSVAVIHLWGGKKSVYVTAESVTRAEPLYNINQPPLINGPALALPLNGRTID